MNRTGFVFAAFLVALALVGWWLSSAGRGAGSGVEPATQAPRELAAPDELESAPAPGAPGAGSDRVGFASGGEGSRTVSAPEAVESDTTEPRARARVTVVEAATGEPLAGFLFLVETEYQVEEVLTRADGSVELALEHLRGRLDFQHVSDPSHERFREPWEFVEDSALIDAELGDVVVVSLRAIPPAARIQVEVVRANGAPAAGAQVQLAQGTLLDGVVRWHRWRFDAADDEGVARFYLHHEEDLDDSFTVGLKEELEGEVSDVVPIGPPLEEGPHRLALYLGSELDVVVIDEEGRPLPGLEVRMGVSVPTRRIHGTYVLTDDRGQVRFAPLPAEPMSVYVRSPRSRRYLVQQDIAIDRNATQTVQLVVPSELLAERLVVSGTVLTLSGEPVSDRMLFVSLDGGEPERMFSREDGSFEFRSTALAKRVTVHAMASIYEPVIEPATTTVAVGTKGLEFREHEDPGEAVVIFQVLDARTGEPVPDEDDVAIRVYLEPGERERIVASSAYGPDDGSTQVEFVPHPGLRWLVTAPGYRERRGVLDTPEPGDDPPILRVEMERGFRREVVVRDRLTAEALAGVGVIDDEGNRLATTGFDGHVVIEGEVWPEWLTFDLEGYEPLRWRARSHWYYYSDRFWLAPVSEPSATEK